MFLIRGSATRLDVNSRIMLIHRYLKIPLFESMKTTWQINYRDKFEEVFNALHHSYTHFRSNVRTSWWKRMKNFIKIIEKSKITRVHRLDLCSLQYSGRIWIHELCIEAWRPFSLLNNFIKESFFFLKRIEIDKL